MRLGADVDGDTRWMFRTKPSTRNMHDPGQWFASRAVTITGRCDPSIFVGLLIYSTLIMSPPSLPPPFLDHRLTNLGFKHLPVPGSSAYRTRSPASIVLRRERLRLEPDEVIGVSVGEEEEVGRAIRVRVDVLGVSVEGVYADEGEPFDWEGGGWLSRGRRGVAH